MKRMTLIAAALCIIMITTIGAGVVAAKAVPVESQNVKQFDVALYQGTGTTVGKLIVNTNAWTYVLNAHGLTPSESYWFKCEGVPGVLATVTPNADGDLHIQGKLNTAPSQLIAPGAMYVLGTGTPPPEATPYISCDAKYCDKSATQYEVFGTVYLYIPNADGSTTRLAVNNAYVVADYTNPKLSNGAIIFGTAVTDPNGNFHMTGSKVYVDHNTFRVSFNSPNNQYGGFDENVQKAGCPIQ